MSSSNVTTNDQYRVSLVKRDKPAGALAHAGNTELLYIVEGAGAVVTGGTLVPAANGKPASIANGVTQKIVKGDVVIVPAGSAHWFSVVDSPITYLEVRWCSAPQARETTETARIAGCPSKTVDRLRRNRRAVR
jgi:mannose-6-phosphate isomerase-like protein (cupin superfamily)